MNNKKDKEASLIRKPLLKWGFALADFLYPPVCPACESRMEVQTGCCGSCREQLLNQAVVKQWSGKGNFVHLHEELFFESAITVWDYQPQVERIIHLIKYEGRARLGCWMGRFISTHLLDREMLSAFDIVTPIPLHAVRRRERGYNQSEMIVHGLLPPRHVMVRDLFKRKKETLTQTTLSADARQNNVDGAFVVKNRAQLKDKRVLVVDDVITTGATLNSSAEVLLRAGARSVHALALARPSLSAI